MTTIEKNIWRKKIMVKEYDKFISLGLNCEVASKIRQFCDSYESYMYGWASIRSVKSLILSLKDGKDMFLTPSRQISNNMFMFEDYGISFHGRLAFDSIKSMDSTRQKFCIDFAENELIERMCYLHGKLSNGSLAGKRILFILKILNFLTYNDTSVLVDEALKINELLKDMLPGDCTYDVLVVTSREFPLVISDTSNIYFRQTSFLDYRDALGVTNSVDWFRDIFVEFRLTKDEKFKILSDAVFKKFQDVSFEAYNFGTVKFDVNHRPSNFIRILLQLNQGLAQKFLQYVFDNHKSFPKYVYDEAVALSLSSNIKSKQDTI